MAGPAAPATPPPGRGRGRNLEVATTFLRVGALNELQYRVNFFLQLVQSVVALATALVVIALVFQHTDEIGGWSPYELLVVLGVHVLLGGVIRALVQPNMQKLMEDIREGTLDYILTKPVDGQLLVSVRQFSLWHLVDVVVGVGVIVFAVVQLRAGIGVVALAVFALAVLLGAVIVYCFWLVITVGAFWVVRMEHVAELFNGLYQAGRWPVTLYPSWLRVVFTVLVPLAFAVTVPAEALTGRAGPTTVAVAVGFTLLVVAFTRWFWRRGLRNYSGASA
jgi:ABC-2 type transport system permease protein